MAELTQYQRYRLDAQALASIGRQVRGSLPRVSVRLPAALADAAVSAWHRDEPDDEPSESDAQQLRAEAGDLALIGLAITERGERSAGWVTVTLDVALAASAVMAASRDDR